MEIIFFNNILNHESNESSSRFVKEVKKHFNNFPQMYM